MNRDQDSFSVERPPPISQPTRDLISFPEEKENQDLKFYTEEQEKNVILGSMYMPFDLMQVKIPNLEKLSKSEILKIFSKNLSNPIEKHFSEDNQLEIPFSIDEDIELFEFSKGDFSFDSLFTFCPSLLPFRSLESIKREIERLKNMSDDQKEKLINEATSIILNEEFSFYAHEEENKTEFRPFACKYRETNVEYSLPNISQNAEQEIERLKPIADLYLKSSINESDLAILRNESFCFSIKKMRTVIGRSMKEVGLVDIDLSLINGFDCSHVSHVQCVLSLLEDFEFYLENTGKLSIRVNGVRLPPRKACRLKNGCIIDIFGTLLAFYPNTHIITKMKNNIERKTAKTKKSKTKK